MGIEDKPEFKAGARSIPAKDMAALSRMVVRQLSGGGGANVRRFGDRMVVEDAGGFAGRPTAFSVKPFCFVSEAADYINCLPALPDLSPNEESAIVKIAKPYLLQRTPWDGETVTYAGVGAVTYAYVSNSSRNASTGTGDDAITELQIILPPYFVGDVILATRTTTGQDGVLWSDINSGGRMWAAENPDDDD